MRDLVEGAVFVTNRAHSALVLTSINSTWKHMRSQNATLKPPPDPPRKPIGFGVRESRRSMGKRIVDE